MYKVVIGLEVHCEVKTVSKNFSSSPNNYSTIPNINVSTVDLGLPGILPVVNEEACRKALKTAMALNCQNPDEIIFDRKNYFYPDLPKGYQITQVTKPMGRNGYLDIFVDDYVKRVDIHQLHLEEDTASLDHYEKYSLIDYNRSGIPLMEIVTEPCISSSDEAISFLEALRSVFIYCGVSDARSDMGQMRCDVNISLMEEDSKVLGTKVEMKNINSFNNVKLAIEYEIERQSKLLDKGEKVVQETRRIAEDGKTYPMRKKVDAVDYKYFIEPNLPPVKLSDEYLEEIRKKIPRLQYERVIDYTENMGISKEEALILVKSREIADYFESASKVCKNYKEVARWVITLVLASLNKLEIELDEFFLTPKMLGEVINVVLDDKLSEDNAKKIIYKAIEQKIDPIEIIKKENISRIDDDESVRKFVIEAIVENPEQVRQYLEEEKDYVKNYFVGKVMQKSNRQANPTKALEIIIEELEKRR